MNIPHCLYRPSIHGDGKEYVERHGKIDKLRKEIKRINPYQYNNFNRSLGDGNKNGNPEMEGRKKKSKKIFWIVCFCMFITISLGVVLQILFDNHTPADVTVKKSVPSTFPLTVYFQDENGVLSNLKGKVTIYLGVEPREEPVREKGNAYFRAVPGEFLGKSVKILPEIKGFLAVDKKTEYELTEEFIYISLKRKMITISGFVKSGETLLKDVGIFLDGKEMNKTDVNGHFEFNVPYNENDDQFHSLEAIKKGYKTPPENIKLKNHNIPINMEAEK